MALMKPEIQKVLRAAGIDKSVPPNEDDTSIQAKLAQAGLGLEDVLSNLANIANNSGNETLRHRANETALKMHGVLKDNVQTVVPSFTIVINDPNSASAEAVPTENPIFLPRQLHKILQNEKVD